MKHCTIILIVVCITILILENKVGLYYNICDCLQENRAQRGVRKYLEKIDRFLKNVLQADGRERLGLL